MADIQIPQRQVPQMQFQGAPGDLIQALYNRPKQGEIASQAVTQAVNDVYNRYLQNQELKAKAFGEGGPYLMNLLYGGGRPQAPGVGATPPTNASAAPQGSAQTLSPQSEYHPQDPSGLIKRSIAAGNPDHAGIYSGTTQSLNDAQAQFLSQYGLGPNDVGQLGSMGGFGTKMVTGLKSLGDVIQQPLAIAEKEANIRSANSKFATPQQGSAVASGDPNAIAQAYGGQAPLEAYQYAGSKQMEKNRAVTGEVGKLSQQKTEVKTLNGMFDNLDKNLLSYFKDPKSYLASGNLYKVSKGRMGSASGAEVINQGKPLVAALNQILTHRFNMAEGNLLSDALAPSPNDTPQYAASKMRMIHQMIKAMDTGNKDNVNAVMQAINGQLGSL